MRAACPRRGGGVLAVSVVSIALFAGCRSRLRGAASVAGEPVPEASVAAEPQAPATSDDVFAHVRGRILDELGTPPPATVYVLRWKGSEALEGPVTDAVTTVTPDANGEFAFDRTLPSSNTLRIDVAGLVPR